VRGVADIDETVKTAVDHGGAVLPDLADDRVDAVLADPAGTACGIRRITEADSATALGVAGALWWGELITDDIERSAGFYRSVFGWSVSVPEGALNRRRFQIDGETVCLLLPRPPAMAKEVPVYWDLYFRIEDLDAAAVAAVEAGGQQLMPATPTEVGQIAVFLDPAGAVFTLCQ
jgi:uncharacterized protein